MMMSYLAGLNPTIYTQTTQSTTYAITPSDFLIMGNPNAGGFTWTLPSAVGLNGKMYAFKNINSSTSNFNLITINTTSAQTIDGASSKTLATQNEELWVISDNANWRILHRYIPSVSVSFTPTGGWNTNVTYTGFWRREGAMASIDFLAALTGAPNAATLTFTLPTGIVIDSAQLINPTGEVVGVGEAAGGGAGRLVQALYASTTSVTMVYSSSTTAALANVTATAPATFGNGDFVQVRIQVPVVGWSS